MKSQISYPATPIIKPEKNELTTYIEGLLPQNHPQAILRSLADKKPELVEGKNALVENDDVVKALSLNEFQLGTLLNTGFPDYIQTFSTDLSIKLQEEYECNTASEKATAHLAAQSYCRIFDLQKRITAYLEKGEVTSIGEKYLSLLSKDLDRAQRHYFNALQTLQLLRHPAINVTVRAQQANFGQNIVAKQETQYATK